MDLSIVIVSYRTPKYLRRCLQTLDAHVSSVSREVLVVDNDSGDESAAIARSFPGVVVIETGQNLGFAGGVNRGLEAARGRYILVFNPDVEVGEGALDTLVEFMDAHPECGLAGPKLLNTDGTLQYSCRRAFSLSAIFLRRTFLGRLFPNARTLRRHLMMDYDHAEPRVVDWVVGAAMMVRREALEDVGPMDERYFLYFEDVDWCTRMAARGWAVYYVPHSVMTHHWQRASRGLGPSARRHLRSGLRFYERWGGLLYVLRRYRAEISLAALVGLDVIGIVAAFLIAFLVRRELAFLLEKPVWSLSYYGGFIAAATLVFLAAFAVNGLYRAVREGDWVDVGFRVIRGSTLGLLVLMATTYVLDMRGYSRFMLAMSFPLVAGFTFLGRRLLDAVTARAARERLNLRRVALLGEDAILDRLERNLREHPELGWEPVRLRHALHGDGRRPEVLGRGLVRERVSEIVITPRSLGGPEEQLAEWVLPLRRQGFQVRVVSTFLASLPARARLEPVGSMAWLNLDRSRLRPGGFRKRLLDITLAVLLGALGTVPALVVGLTLLLRGRSLWEPEREFLGRWGETFRARRLAGGGWVRHYPLLGSVLRGVCSVVGPRPLVPGSESPGGRAWAWVREHYRPGLTGPWSLTPGLPPEEEMHQELRYLEDWSPERDLKLLARVALRGSGRGRGNGSTSSSARASSGAEQPRPAVPPGRVTSAGIEPL